MGQSDYDRRDTVGQDHRPSHVSLGSAWAIESPSAQWIDGGTYRRACVWPDIHCEVYPNANGDPAWTVKLGFPGVCGQHVRGTAKTMGEARRAADGAALMLIDQIAARADEARRACLAAMAKDET